MSDVKNKNKFVVAKGINWLELKTSLPSKFCNLNNSGNFDGKLGPRKNSHLKHLERPSLESIFICVGHRTITNQLHDSTSYYIVRMFI